MPRRPEPDEKLMIAYQAGDASAFEELLLRYQGDLYNYMGRFLKSREQVQEAFQEVFEKIIRNGKSYNPQLKFSTWLYTIAHNQCIDIIRKNKHRQALSLNESYVGDDSGEGGGLEEVLADDAPQPDVQVGAGLLEEKLHQVLDTLNPDQKEVFLLREMQGLAYEEIAEILKINVNTVKSRMRYALSGLQKIFKKWGI